MQRPPVDISIFRTAAGRRPFEDWFQRLADRSVQARVMQRLDRLQSGNPGDCSARSRPGGIASRRWTRLSDLFRMGYAGTLPHPLRRFQANTIRRHREGTEVAGRSKKSFKPMNRRVRGGPAISYDEWARNILADSPELSGEYLREVIDQSATPEELLLGLRRIAEAKGMSRVAEAAGLSRESLYRSLSAAGNPRLSTLVAVLRVAGLRLSVRPAN